MKLTSPPLVDSSELELAAFGTVLLTCQGELIRGQMTE